MSIPPLYSHSNSCVIWLKKKKKDVKQPNGLIGVSNLNLIGWVSEGLWPPLKWDMQTFFPHGMLRSIDFMLMLLLPKKGFGPPSLGEDHINLKLKIRINTKFTKHLFLLFLTYSHICNPVKFTLQLWLLDRWRHRTQTTLSSSPLTPTHFSPHLPLFHDGKRRKTDIWAHCLR